MAGLLGEVGGLDAAEVVADRGGDRGGSLVERYLLIFRCERPMFLPRPLPLDESKGPGAIGAYPPSDPRIFIS
jgi:hypothetical protein